MYFNKPKQPITPPTHTHTPQRVSKPKRYPFRSDVNVPQCFNENFLPEAVAGS